MNIDKRKQLVYQKTEFNKSLICQLPNILKCSKCRRNNTLQQTNNSLQNYQNCLFCGNPIYIINKNITIVS